MKCIVSLGEGLVLETVTYFRCLISRGNEEFSSWTSSSWLELVDMARARENRDTRRYAVDRDKTSEGCAACASYGKSIMYNQ